MQAPLILRFPIDQVNHEKVTGRSVSDATHSEHKKEVHSLDRPESQT